jgi:nitrite reductase (NADH) large subunit
MRSSDENIFCVGDVAELPGAVSGLWSVGNEQGKVAADVIAGGDARYSAAALPPVQLKMTGIDLKSFGSLSVDEQTTAYSVGSVASNCWRSVLVKGHRLKGGVFVNSPLAASAAIKLAKNADRDIWEQDVLDILHKDDEAD